MFAGLEVQVTLSTDVATCPAPSASHRPLP